MVGEYEKKILMSLASGDKDWAKLKEETNLADGTLAKYLKKLLQDGIILEKINPKDRRKKIYSLKMDSEMAVNSISISTLSFLIAYSILKNVFRVPRDDEEYEEYIDFLTWMGDVVLLGLTGTEESFQAISGALDLVFRVINENKECVDPSLKKENEIFWENFWNEWKAAIKKSLIEDEKFQIPDRAKRILSPTPPDPEMPVDCLSALLQLIDKTPFKIVEFSKE